MANSDKDSKATGCIVIGILVMILWGITSLISGKGFFTGIQDNIEAGVYLGVIALIVYAIFKIFIDK